MRVVLSRAAKRGGELRNSVGGWAGASAEAPYLVARGKVSKSFTRLRHDLLTSSLQCLWVLLPPPMQVMLPGCASPLSGSDRGIAGVDAGACSLRGAAQGIPWDLMLIQHLKHHFFSVNTGNDKCLP